MKKLLAIITVVGITAMAGTAMAVTANLDVSAKITAACSVTGGALDFGALDPLTAPLVTKDSTGVSVTCTNGAGYTIALDKGEHISGGTQANLSNGTDNIPYSVSSPASGTGSGAAQPITITGTIAAGSYSTASAGTYGDTMVITVTP